MLVLNMFMIEFNYLSDKGLIKGMLNIRLTNPIHNI